MFKHVLVSSMRYQKSLNFIKNFESMEQRDLKNVNNHLNTNIYSYLETSEAVFLVMCNPSMNKLWAT